MLSRPSPRLRKPTSIEQRMNLFLTELGLIEGEDFFREFNFRLSNGGIRIFDFYFPRQKIAIECDGTYWHRNRWRDFFKDVQTNWDEITVLRFSEEDIEKDGTKVMEELKTALCLCTPRFMGI